MLTEDEPMCWLVWSEAENLINGLGKILPSES